MLGVFLDTEANGLNVFRHFIIEVAYKVLDVGTGKEIAAFTSPLKCSEEEWEGSDPQSLKVNGFTWEDVKDAPPRATVGSTIKHDFAKLGIERGKAVFICQNPSFDRVFFSQLVDADTQEQNNWPYHWLDLASMYWAIETTNQSGEYPWETGFTKDKIAKRLGVGSEAQPHRAMNGVDHLILCYEKVVGFPLPL